MVVAVIHNPERKERMHHFLNQCDVQGIKEVIWFPAIFSSTPQEGISKAHKQVVKYAKDNGLEEILILEDDVQFTDFGAFDYMLTNKPDNYHLYFGGMSGVFIDERQTTPVKDVLSNFSGFFCYMVHNSFYDVFLSADESFHIDCWCATQVVERFVMETGKKPLYKCLYPMVAITKNGYSDNFKIDMDYSTYFKMCKLWQNKSRNM